MRTIEQINKVIDKIETTLENLTILVTRDYEKRIADLEKQLKDRNCDDGK